MQEIQQWDVVQTIVVIAGLFITLGAPILKLNSTIVKATSKISELSDRADRSEKDFHKHEEHDTLAHKRLWDKNKEQDDVINAHNTELQDHEFRITQLEKM